MKNGRDFHLELSRRGEDPDVWGLELRCITPGSETWDQSEGELGDLLRLAGRLIARVAGTPAPILAPAEPEAPLDRPATALENVSTSARSLMGNTQAVGLLTPERAVEVARLLDGGVSELRDIDVDRLDAGAEFGAELVAFHRDLDRCLHQIQRAVDEVDVHRSIRHFKMAIAYYDAAIDTANRLGALTPTSTE